MQQSPQIFGMPTQQQQQQPPNTTVISTEQIQKYLDENKQLILAIMESQNLGKINECAQYQAQLQKNLMYLAAIADAQPPASTSPSQTQPQPQTQPQQQPQLQTQSQMPMQAAIPQGPAMHPPQAAFNQNQQLQQQLQLQQQQQHQQQQQQQQQTVGYGPRMAFMGQPYDQQSHLIQQQQTMAGMMGLRMSGAGGLHPALQAGHGTAAHFMDARIRPDGPEAGLGDGQGK
ncbi:hypothetical protein vseg_001363 [Gypsophila vaccaria]